MPELNVTQTVLIAASREQVWTALTDPSIVTSWFSEDAEIDLSVGGAAVFRWEELGRFRAVVEEVDPTRVFAFRWAQSVDTDPVAGEATHVRFTLDENGSGTRLTVTETGWESLAMDAHEIESKMAENTEGWQEELDELVAFLAGA